MFYYNLIYVLVPVGYNQQCFTNNTFTITKHIQFSCPHNQYANRINNKSYQCIANVLIINLPYSSNENKYKNTAIILICIFSLELSLVFKKLDLESHIHFYTTL